MFEVIRKSMLAGIGAVVLTAEKVQEATRKLVEEGKISTEEAERLTTELLKSGERQWDDMTARLSETIKKGMDNLDFIKRKEFEELRTRVEVLEQRLALLEEEKRQDRIKVKND